MCSTSVVGDSTGHLQGKQGSGVLAEEKQGSSKQEAPSQGWGRRTTSGLATQVGGVATPGLYFLLRARAIQTHGACCGGWSYPPGKGSDVKSQERGGVSEEKRERGGSACQGARPLTGLTQGRFLEAFSPSTLTQTCEAGARTLLTPQQALVSAAYVEHRQEAVVGRRHDTQCWPKRDGATAKVPDKTGGGGGCGSQTP